MPNWTTNKLTGETKNGEIFTFAGKDLYTKDEYGQLQFDFNKLIPMPQSLNVTCGSVTDRAIIYYLTERCTIPICKLSCEKQHTLMDAGLIRWDGWKGPNDIFSKLKHDIDEKMPLRVFEQGKSVDLYDLGRQYINNLAEYGYTTWYDWCCDKWGTKWNACDSDVCNDFISFKTAWDAPIPVISALSRKYPDVLFSMDSVSEDGDICLYQFKNGQQL